MTPFEKLTALRAHLRQEGFQGLLVPHTDRYRHEFLPPQARDLEWLTGFDGSAGLGLILQDRAAVFVDGRYTLQARVQVDLELFSIQPYTWASIKEWLSQSPCLGRVGVDPWRVSLEEGERYKALFQENGCVFDPSLTTPAPLEVLWKERPKPTQNPIVMHPLSFCGRSLEEKLKEVCQTLQERGIDAALLSLDESLCWLFNIRGQDVPYAPLVQGFALVHQTGAFDLFVDPKKVSPLVRDMLTQRGGRLHDEAVFEQVLQAYAQQKKTLLLDQDTAPLACAWLIEQAGGTVVADQDPCLVPKARKNTAEIQGAQRAHLQDGVALARFFAWLEECRFLGKEVSEQSASKQLLEERARGPDFKGMSFETIAGSGPNGAIVHYRVTPQSNRTLQPGDLFLIDSGGQYLCGTTDVTRTIFWGETPSSLQKEHFTRVLKGHIALAKARFPQGTTGHQLDALARVSLWEVGLDYRHGTGHGVGSYLGVHEGPQSISTAPRPVPLEPGMIVSNEPGYYWEGHYGIRIESLQFVKKSASWSDTTAFYDFETLTLAPIERVLVEDCLLTLDEKAWLNVYHARVWEALSPHLEEPTLAWLKEKTQPL